jgi:hypothetical protein
MSDVVLCRVICGVRVTAWLGGLDFWWGEVGGEGRGVEWRRERQEKGIERERHPISISFGCLVACPVRFPSDLIPNLPIRDTLFPISIVLGIFRFFLVVAFFSVS